MNLNELIAALQKLQLSHGELIVLCPEGYLVRNVAVYSVKQHQVDELNMSIGQKYIRIANYS